MLDVYKSSGYHILYFGPKQTEKPTKQAKSLWQKLFSFLIEAPGQVMALQVMEMGESSSVITVPHRGGRTFTSG